MPRYAPEPEYRHDDPVRSGVLMVNLGTPEAPTPGALRRYLAEFLSDTRIIEAPRAVWLPVLHGIVLRTRPKRSAHAYQSVWSDRGSPLAAISADQAAALQQALDPAGERLRVALAMRYGEPSVRAGLEALRAAGCARVLVLPMYPQYSATTTASVFDAVFDVFKTWRRVPELRTVANYHDDPGFIAALAGSIGEAFAAHGRPDRLLFSFHGIPRQYFDAGDPYFCHCQKTARLVAEKLGLADDFWSVSFQSRFGPKEWLKPYTDETLKGWGSSGVGSVAVVCPGFSADCLETLEEIGVENRDYFLGAGGREFRYIPALNARTDHIEALAALVNRHFGGWPASGPTEDERSASAARAKAIGASR
ncbi:MAG: ferrochelatase [Chromatiales bacterium]|nr:ferrochelatase [Chromatiales bacterium]